VAELRIMTDMESKLLDKTLQLLGGKQLAFQFDRDDKRFVGADVLDGLAGECLEYLGDYHRREPMRQGLSRAELISGFGRGMHPKLVHFLVERLVKSGQVLLEADILRLPGHVVSLASDQSGLRTLMETAYTQAGFMPPTTKAFLEENGLAAKDVAQMYRLLMEEGVLIKVSEEFYYARTAMEEIVARVRGFFESNQEMGPQDFRDLTGVDPQIRHPGARIPGQGKDHHAYWGQEADSVASFLDAGLKIQFHVLIGLQVLCRIPASRFHGHVLLLQLPGNFFGSDDVCLLRAFVAA
jgi:selenocysteine-specific elongation factor